MKKKDTKGKGAKKEVKKAKKWSYYFQFNINHKKYNKILIFNLMSTIEKLANMFILVGGGLGLGTIVLN